MFDFAGCGSCFDSLHPLQSAVPCQHAFRYIARHRRMQEPSARSGWKGHIWLPSTLPERSGSASRIDGAVACTAWSGGSGTASWLPSGSPLPPRPLHPASWFRFRGSARRTLHFGAFGLCRLLPRVCPLARAKRSTLVTVRGQLAADRAGRINRIVHVDVELRRVIQDALHDAGLVGRKLARLAFEQAV